MLAARAQLPAFSSATWGLVQRQPQRRVELLQPFLRATLTAEVGAVVVADIAFGRGHGDCLLKSGIGLRKFAKVCVHQPENAVRNTVFRVKTDCLAQLFECHAHLAALEVIGAELGMYLGAVTQRVFAARRRSLRAVVFFLTDCRRR